MQYALLIHSQESALPDHMEEAERKAFYAEFRKVIEEMEERGAFVTARRLDTVDTATTQRVADGELITTDGPFAETKECLAGFILVDTEDLDEALEWAGRLPSARIGCVEVRPVRQ